MIKDFFARTCAWFVTAGQQPAVPEPSPAQTAFYIGMQLEELAEKLEVFFGAGPETPAARIQDMGKLFKSGAYDAAAVAALANPDTAKAMLDADMDLIWVTLGGARAQGADVQGAYNAVDTANWAKFTDGKATLHPVTRKVLKPEGWKAPDLTPFIHASLK